MSAKVDVQLNDFPNLFSLADKVAVVTGGSRGLGLHAASALLQAGAAKVFITSRKAAACDEACAALNALPNIRGSAVAIPADLAKAGEVERLVREVEKQTDHVDILLANAGATWGAAFDEHPEQAFGKVMDLNVKSVFVCVQKCVYPLAVIPFCFFTHWRIASSAAAHNVPCRFAPLLRRNASLTSPSRVIITASIAGMGVGTLGANATFGYSASKAAALHLARNLALELGPQGILVNSIAPGFFPTKMASGLMELSGGVEKLAKASPNRRLGTPEDIAGAVVFLCSRAGGHVNGGNVVLDGGSVLQAKL